MVKVFALIPRRPDVSQDFFHEHWAGPHAELAKRITTLRGYVQSHRIEPGVMGLPASIYEGIAEVWFDDAATAAGMGEDPNYAEGAHLDEPNFIDTDNLGFLLSEVEVQREGPPIAKDDPGAKAMLLLNRADGLSPADFAQRIRSADLAAAVPDATRVSVAVALPDMYADGAEPTFDAVVELWFPSVDAFSSAWTAKGRQVAQALDGLVSREASAAFLGEELRVLWPEGVPAPA
ncbi:MAG: Ethyl tert-butyl ether degradation EthD [Solirubrobacterales bacterium]|jgi:uncharacterized protein (TIGR02118 family)|nr:Ethyl tert-butyl ether degradation EthD [Solirubrobacterales bacterium]